MSLQPPITTVSAFSLADPRIKQAMAALLCFLLSLAGGVHAREEASDLPMLSVSVLQFGTAHWELDHLLHRELDREYGYRLELKPVANLPASKIGRASCRERG